MHHGEGCVQWAVSRVCAPWGGLCSVAVRQNQLSTPVQPCLGNSETRRIIDGIFVLQPYPPPPPPPPPPPSHFSDPVDLRLIFGDGRRGDREGGKPEMERSELVLTNIFFVPAFVLLGCLTKDCIALRSLVSSWTY